MVAVAVVEVESDGVTRARGNPAPTSPNFATATRASVEASVRHEYDELSLNTTNGNYHEFEYSGP